MGQAKGGTYQQIQQTKTTVIQKEWEKISTGALVKTFKTDKEPEMLLSHGEEGKEKNFETWEV